MRTPSAVLIAGVALACLGIAPAPGPVDLGEFPLGLRFEAPLIEVAKVGRYADAVEILRTGAGLVVVNDVPLDTYVEGVAEVPRGWPMEALKAQAVAARTYAWWVMLTSEYPAYDICGTVDCQVFAGREVVEAPLGERWVRAVAETSGEVLTYRAGPVLARYSSSSGGRTRDNEEVFPEDGRFPYLQGVDDPYDEVSPWHRWQVVFPREQLDAILAGIEAFAPAVPVEGYEHLPSDGRRPDLVRFTGVDGRVAVAPATEFRFGVSEVAPRMFPGRYPSVSGGRRLPQTIPSTRFAFEVAEDAVMLDGRGYGHGVGMSQYGALGRAAAGHRYDEILAAYYGGLEPTRGAELPPRVRVGVADGAGAVTVTVPAAVRILGDRRVVSDEAAGTYLVRPGPDGTVLLRGPARYGAPPPPPAAPTSPAPRPSEDDVLVTLPAPSPMPSAAEAAPPAGGGDGVPTALALIAAVGVLLAAVGTWRASRDSRP